MRWLTSRSRPARWHVHSPGVHRCGSRDQGPGRRRAGWSRAARAGDGDLRGSP